MKLLGLKAALNASGRYKYKVSMNILIHAKLQNFSQIRLKM